MINEKPEGVRASNFCIGRRPPAAERGAIIQRGGDSQVPAMYSQAEA